MKRLLLACLAFVAVAAFAAPAFAQQSAPEIAFEFGAGFPEAAAGHEFRRGAGRCGELQGPHFRLHPLEQRQWPGLCARRRRSFWNSPRGNFCGEIGKGLYAWSFAHTVRIDKDDNIWAIDKGSDMIVKFNPGGRVIWVFGRRKESADDDTKPWEHVNPPLPPIDGLFRQPTDVAWDQRQHLHHRRLHQFARREIRQERQLGEVLGRAGNGPGPVPPPAFDRDRQGTTMSMLATARNHRIQVFDTDGKFLRMFSIDVPPEPGDTRRLWQHADGRETRAG